MTELLPCPICGDKLGNSAHFPAGYGYDSDSQSEQMIACMFCGLSLVEESEYASEPVQYVCDRLVESWNTRAPIVIDDAMVERAARAWGAHIATSEFDSFGRRLRAALEAALNPQEKPE